MKSIFSIKSLLVLLLSFTSIEGAYCQLTISGEIRPRAEFRNGFKKPIELAAQPAFFIEQRSRVNLHYKKEALTYFISAQDVRIWGNTSQIYKSDPALTNLYEAWAAYKFTPKTEIQIGRQSLDYDNARFLGDLDWAQQGRSHDLVLLKCADSLKYQLHIGAAFNQSIPFEPGKLTGTLYEGLDNYKTMQFGWFHKKMTFSDFSLLILNDGRQNSDPQSGQSHIFYRQTYGGITRTKLSPRLDAEGELYYQGGKDPKGSKVSAWLLAGSLTYKTGFMPFTLGMDYLSGSGPRAAGNTSFQPLYGTNHKFYGFMDYFYVGNNHGNAGKTAGLQDLFLKTNITLNSKNKILIHFHHFRSPVTVFADEQMNMIKPSHLGEEIDLVWNAQISPEVSFNLGYSQMFGTESLNAIKEVESSSAFQCWAWAMLTVKPTFLK